MNFGMDRVVKNKYTGAIDLSLWKLFVPSSYYFATLPQKHQKGGI